MDMEKLDCGHEPSPHSDITTGYGITPDGKKHCYACCAENDKARMIETGRATLYLTKEKESGRALITNWPGSLIFRGGPVRAGRHNIARCRYDAWFTGPDGATWHAVQYGDNTQIAHCKRVRA
jgi:hypothetical protein